ncbi:MAG: hypothetical protein KDK90_13875 [Leptospiraceae bacterium]|nr:hypothetical protein [Leptospiraceae bacterium]
MSQCYIRPSIFIGLGSSGTEVLNYTREYFYEEFGVSGLPIFYYLSISTDKQDMSSQIFGIKEEEYEKIHTEKIFIHSMDDVISRLDPKQTTLYSQYRGMDDWFDRNILKKSLNSVNVGVGGIRQIGRLALWMNLEKVLHRIQQFKSVVKDKNAREKIREGILKHYNLRKKNQVMVDIDSSGEVDVYIISSLVGGSGSGIFTDIALLTKTELETQIGKNKVNIYGFFTAMDHTTVGMTRGFNTPAANTMASLYELNYFHGRKGGLFIQYPFHSRAIEFEDPFNDIFIMTPSILDEQTYQSSNAFDGEKEQSLMRRILGLTIFLNTSGSAILERSQKVNIDLVVSADGYDKPKPEPDPGFIRFLHIFGLYVVWFPKNRIADCASYLTIKNFINDWFGNEEKTLEKKSQIADDVENCYEIFFKKSYNEFIQDGKTNLDSEFRTDLSNAEIQVKAETDIADLKSKLYQVPNGNSLVQNLKTGSRYERFLESRVISFKNQFTKLVNERVEALLFSYLEKETYTIQDIKVWVDLMIHQIEYRLPDFPDAFSEVDLNSIHVEKYFNMNLWKTVSFQKSKTLENGKKMLLKDFFSLAEDSWLTMKSVYIKKALLIVLENLRIFQNTFLSSFENKLLAIKMKSEESFLVQSEFYLSPKRIRIVTMLGGSIAEDAVHIANRVMELGMQKFPLFKEVFYKSDSQDITKRNVIKQIMEDELTSAEAKTEFVGRLCNQIKDKILNDYYTEIFGGFSLIDKYSKLNLSELLDDYSQSQVLASTSHTYHPLPLNKRPNFSGGGGEKLNEVIEKIESHLPWMQSYKTTGMHLDNIIFYYREIPGIAVSDLKLYDVFKPIYSKNPSGEIPNHHIDKNPSKFDPEKFRKIDAAREDIFSIFVLLKDKLFESKEGKLIYRYQDLLGRPRVAFMNDGDFILETTSNEVDFETGKNRLYYESEKFYSHLLKDKQYTIFEAKIRDECVQGKDGLVRKAVEIVEDLYNRNVLLLEKAEEIREILYNFIDKYSQIK